MRQVLHTGTINRWFKEITVKWAPSLSQDHLHELLVVDVALGVLLAVDKLLNLFLSHLLPQSSQQVPQLHSRYLTISFLVEVPESFHEVVSGVRNLPAAHGSQQGQECLEGKSRIWTSGLG